MSAGQMYNNPCTEKLSAHNCGTRVLLYIISQILLPTFNVGGQ